MKKIYTLVVLAVFSLAWTSLSAQSVKGRVTGPDKAGLPGVVVKDQISGMGAATDIDGNYSFNLTAGAHKIEFILLGFETQVKDINLAAGETFSLNVQMTEDQKITEEVVVVGYGVQRKREVTGSISKIDGKELTRLPVPSFEAALQGQAAGVQVTQGSGMAGSGSLLRIRGIASVSAGGDPLYVVDGIPITQNQFINGNSGAMNNNPLASINPNDIESVEILKDAAATGIYGSRGANGVVLITTKRGKGKGFSVDYTTRFGISTPATLPNMMNTDQYLTIRQEAWENDGGTGYVWLPGFTSANDPASTREAAFKNAQKTNTDWVDLTTGTGFKMMHSASLTHTGAKHNLYAGVTYDDNGSYLIGNTYKRLSGRVNLDYQLHKNLKMMASVSNSQGRNERVDAAWSGGLGLAMSTALPYYPERYTEDVYNTDGTLAHEAGDYYFWNNGYTNPVATREAIKWQSRENRVISNMALIFTPIKDLNIKASGSYDYMDFRDYRYVPADLFPNSPVGTGETKPSWTNNWNTSLTADYIWQFMEDQRLTFLVGAETQKQTTTRYNNINYTFVNGPSYEDDFETNSTIVQKSIGTPEIWTFVSTFARVNYAIKDKYFFQGVSRLDGSSKFGENSKYGFFPSVSAGWVISEEKFLKDNKTINFLKLRAGWGKSGNSDIPGDAQYGTFSPTDNGITYNGQPIIYPIKLSNPDLRWETTQTMDVTLEMGLWKDRVSFTLSAYRKDTKDALMNVSLPASTGFTSYWDNVATILNQGLELSIKTFNINKPNFEWSTNFNIARNYNELVDIGNYTPDAVSGGTNDSRVIVGKPIGSFYLMEFSHVDPTTGRPVYIDTQGNETFDYDNNQRKYVGDGLPDFIGGLTNNFRYKNFDCQILATFSLGAKIFDSSGKRQMGVVSDWNMRTDVLDRWRQPGDVATYPRMTLNETTYDLPSGFPWWNTSLFIYKADFLRLRNFSVGYNFDIKNSPVKSFRAGFNITNLFTLTNFPGLDPELVRDFENPQDRNLSPNVTYLTPPQERSYNLQLSVTF